MLNKYYQLIHFPKFPNCFIYSFDESLFLKYFSFYKVILYIYN